MQLKRFLQRFVTLKSLCNIIIILLVNFSVNVSIIDIFDENKYVLTASNDSSSLDPELCCMYEVAFGETKHKK